MAVYDAVLHRINAASVNYQIVEKGVAMKKHSLMFSLIACLVAPEMAWAQQAEMPAPAMFKVGDTWEWRQVDTRTKLEEGKRTRTVVDDEGVLKFSTGTGSLQISAAFIGNPSSKPWRVWPLEVGKKWTYEEDWSRPDGVTGNTQQDVTVVAYESVTVPAGTFMAFRIEHKGWYRNSRGRSGKQDDTFWYAPDAYADVRHVRDDGHNAYMRELVAFRRAAQ